MTETDKEKNRLEDLQLENFATKRAKSVKKVHDRLEKIKKIEKHKEKK